MKKEDFYNSKWDCSEWTEEQKTQWQEKCLELGFTWRGTLGKSKCEEYITHAKSCYLYGGGYITFNSSVGGYLPHSNTEKQFSDMFPEKLDVVAEIVKMVQESSEVPDQEDERGFEGLVYHCPKHLGKYVVIDIEKLSDDQKKYLIGNLEWSKISYKLQVKDSVSGYLNLCENNDDCWFYQADFDKTMDTEISFNKIFKYKED